jgi:hypothetical protein
LLVSTSSSTTKENVVQLRSDFNSFVERGTFH